MKDAQLNEVGVLKYQLTRYLHFGYGTLELSSWPISINWEARLEDDV